MRSCLPAAILCALLLAGCADDRPTEQPYRVKHDYALSDPQFQRTIGSLLGPPLIGGNSTTTLVNGDRIFPSMLEAIRDAQKSIDFETYIYWRGSVAQQFTDALCDRAARGVKVNVIIDTVGSDKLDKKYVGQMKEAGAKVVLYHPLRWYDWTSANKLNNRTHRKLLIIDGQIGFTGGVAVADEWLGNADSPKHYRTTIIELKGRPSRSCKPPLPTTGWKPPARFFAVTIISRR